MKTPSSPQVGIGPGREQSIEADTATVLAALEDDDCRAILAATEARALSAGEISEACELPLSTAYRKIDQLGEGIRISSGGQHTSEYSLEISDIHLSLGEGGVELEVTGRAGPDGLDSAVAGTD